ncbi:MAG: hypothetical protein J7M06_06020, partial [Proteobacteria bacterium]|nr:hypothetical protein [Pseudomonadota bacterium]
MDSFSAIINSIKKPLFFISRTDFKKIDLVKDLETTIPNLADRATTFTSNDIQKDLLLELKEKFSDFSRFDPAEKVKTVKESLEIVEQIESEKDYLKKSTPDNDAFLIVDRLKKLSVPIQYI